MAEMKLDGGAARGRSMLVPILLALLLLGAAAAWFAWVYVHPAVTGSVTAVQTFPVHVEYKRPTGGGGAMTVGPNQAEDALYVVTDVAVANHSDVPLFLSSFAGKFNLPDGSEMQASVIETGDLSRLMAMFPKLKAVTDSTGAQPLRRDQTVRKGASARGYLVMYYNVPPNIWEGRKAAEVTVNFYHQDPLTLPLPK